MVINDNDNYNDDDKLKDSDIIVDYEGNDDETEISNQNKKKTFLDNLKRKTGEIKNHSWKIGKTTAKSAEELGNKIDNVIDESVNAAKNIGTSKNEILDLIERLAKMKDQGIITEQEFTKKKKDLLEKI